MEWISVKDQKPPRGVSKCCLFFNGKSEVTYGYAYEWEDESEDYVWINDMDRETNEVARYWMPLPKSPKEFEEKNDEKSCS